MPKRKDRKNLKQGQRLQLKLSFKMIVIVAIGVFSIAAGVFFYINFSNVKNSKAIDVSIQNVQSKPVDFNVAQLKTDFVENKLNGVSVRKAIDLSTLNK